LQILNYFVAAIIILASEENRLVYYWKIKPIKNSRPPQAIGNLRQSAKSAD